SRIAWLISAFPHTLLYRGLLPHRKECSRLKAVLQAPPEPFPPPGNGPGYGGLVDPQLLGYLGHGQPQVVVEVEHFRLAGGKLRSPGPAEVPPQPLELFAVILPVGPVPGGQIRQEFLSPAGAAGVRACSAHCCDTSCRSTAPVPERFP